MAADFMQFLKQIVANFSKDGCAILAAALAYYAAFALPPLLYLLLTLLTFGLSVYYEDEQAGAKARGALENHAARMLGNPEISEEISTILQTHQRTSGQWWKTLLSFGGIVVGATGVVVALQTAMNQVWQVKPDPETSGIGDLLWKRLLSFMMILGLAFLLLVSLVVSAVVTGMGEQLGDLIGMGSRVAATSNYLLHAALVGVIFAAIFKWVPDAEIQWRDAVAGAVMTTLLFLVGRFAIQLYFSYSAPAAQVGAAAASLAVVLIWVYYTGMIVLLGAEVTQVYAARHGRGIRPEKHAVLVIEQYRRPNEDGTMTPAQ